MAGKLRDQAHTLDLRFIESPAGFSFFQTARLLECAHPDKPRLGHATNSADEPIQFCQEPSLSFAPATLQRYETSEKTGKPRLMVNFMGLLGPQGPMPLHITDYVRDRELNHDDHTLARFFDIFNHRMISFFYRAWASNRQTVSYDRPHEDRFSVYIASLMGIGLDSLRLRDHVPDEAKLYFSGHLSCQTRHAEGLCAILKDYFDIKTSIQEFIGQWIDIPEANRSRLGDSPDTATLGVNMVMGSQIWDCRQKFRIIMGPMSFERYERMLPGGKSFEALKAWTKNYVGDQLEWEAQLILKAAEVPKMILGKSGRLGWTTWLQSYPFEKDVKDLILQPEASI